MQLRPECSLHGNLAFNFVLNVFDEACNLGNEIFDRLFFLLFTRWVALKLQFAKTTTEKCTSFAVNHRHPEHHLLISHLATLGQREIRRASITGHASTRLLPLVPQVQAFQKAPSVQFLSNLNIIFSRFIAWDHQQRARWSRWNCSGKKNWRVYLPTRALQWFNRNLSLMVQIITKEQDAI